MLDVREHRRLVRPRVRNRHLMPRLPDSWYRGLPDRTRTADEQHAHAATLDKQPRAEARPRANPKDATRGSLPTTGPARPNARAKRRAETANY